jgi:hypothetical protein
VVGGGDEALHFYDTKKSFELLSSTWIESNTGFSMLFWLSRAPYLYVVYLLNNFLYIPSFFLQATSFFLIIVTGVISVYYLTLHFLSKHNLRHYIALISALFYLLNPYSMTQVWARGQYAQYFSFAIIPLTLLLFVIAIKKRKYIFAPIIALVTLPFATAYGFLTVVVIQWFLFFFYCVYTLLVENNKKQTAIFLSTFLLATLSIWTLVHAWWLLPLITSSNTILVSYVNSVNENLGSLIGVSHNFTPLVLIRLLQDTYFFAPSAFSPYYSILRFQIISFLLPIFLLIGLVTVFKIKELKQFRFFVWLFSAGLFISLGANPPFGDIFIWVFQHIPPLQMFRNPYEKFGLVLVMAYAPLFALGFVYSLYGIHKTRIFNKLQVLAIGGIVLFLLNLYLFPLWTGKIVAFPDDKIGLPHMSYYTELENFLDKQANSNHRILMTPLWGGDGAFYMWGEKRYQGIDPMPFFINHEVVSSSVQIPFYIDLIRNLRQNLYQEDVSGVLSLLRIKYLVNREDAVFTSSIEKQHVQLLTEKIYPPSDFNQLSMVVCENQFAVIDGANPAWVTCILPTEMQDLHTIKYLHVIAKANMPANLDVAVNDNQKNRSNWYGKIPGEYSLKADEWTTIIIPLGVPTEPNNSTDFSKIESIDLRAHPFYRHNESVDRLDIQGIWLDPGTEKSLDNFKLIQQFGKLDVFQYLHSQQPPEFGVIATAMTINSLDELVTESYNNLNELDRKGFVVSLQNENKNLEKLTFNSNLVVTDTEKIARERFWIKTKGSGEGLVILSKTFNTGWKLIEDVEKNELSGGLLADVKLLKKSFVNEENHFVVNGYANLWKVNGESDKYAVVYLPQLYADIGTKISLLSVITIIVTLLLIIIKRRFYGKR